MAQQEMIVGPYRLVERIGVGGMGMVYRGKHTRIGREAAIKILPSNLALEGDFLKRFEREASSIASLEHPNILPVWEYGDQEGIPYLVMPLVRGGTLKEKLQGGRLSLQQIGQFLNQMAEALDYAHERGIVHRDVKPANMLLNERGHLYLADFGIAKALQSGEGLTRTGVGVGTPEYMAPEQAQGRADNRSDLYALTIILYQMLTGKVPYSGNSVIDTLMKHINEPLPLGPLRALDPPLPPAIEEILRKGTAKDPDERYQTGAALAEAFSGAIAARTDPTIPLAGGVGGFPASGHTPPPGFTPPPGYTPSGYTPIPNQGTGQTPAPQTGSGSYGPMGDDARTQFGPSPTGQTPYPPQTGQTPYPGGPGSYPGATGQTPYPNAGAQGGYAPGVSTPSGSALSPLPPHQGGQQVGGPQARPQKKPPIALFAGIGALVVLLLIAGGAFIATRGGAAPPTATVAAQGPSVAPSVAPSTPPTVAAQVPPSAPPTTAPAVIPTANIPTANIPTANIPSASFPGAGVPSATAAPPTPTAPVATATLAVVPTFTPLPAAPTGGYRADFKTFPANEVAGQSRRGADPATGEFVISVLDGSGDLQLVDASYQNFILEVDIRKTAGATDAGYGIIFRQQEKAATDKEESNYLFFMRSNGDYSLFYSPGDGTAQRPASSFSLGNQPNPIKPGEGINRLTITCRGGEITVAVNGQTIGRYTGPLVKAGKFALAVSAGADKSVTTVAFNNFRIAPLTP